MLGFSAGLVAPTAFGVILDLAGGAQSGRAWAASFIMLAVPNLVAIVVLRWLTGTRAAPQVVARFAARLGADRELSGGRRRPGALGR